MLFEEFGKLCINHPDAGLDSLLDYFLSCKNQEDAAFIEQHFTLFVKSGYAARSAPEAVKEVITGKKRN